MMRQNENANCQIELNDVILTANELKANFRIVHKLVTSGQIVLVSVEDFDQQKLRIVESIRLKDDESFADEKGTDIIRTPQSDARWFVVSMKDIVVQ